jgi:hypothetical protein
MSAEKKTVPAEKAAALFGLAVTAALKRSRPLRMKLQKLPPLLQAVHNKFVEGMVLANESRRIHHALQLYPSFVV